MAFADTLKSLPDISHLAALQLIDPVTADVIHTIENKPGQIGSLTVYYHLAQTFSSINSAAAARGLELYGEHTTDAHANPGKHPNIDRLIELGVSKQELCIKAIPVNGT